MFTGLIQGLGTLRSLDPYRLQITCQPDSSGLLQDLALGDSVAVDGICLTVVEILTQGFIVDASPETRDRTTLGQTAGALVNLEPSLRVGSKLGGHFVTGHVDGTGLLQASVQTATSWEMTFEVSDRVARYIVSKGSVAVNGISLTVADCDAAGSWFRAAVIPLTYAETNLRHLRPGNLVNLEGDVLGKYVEKFLQFPTDQAGRSTPMELSAAFLAEHGYG